MCTEFMYSWYCTVLHVTDFVPQITGDNLFFLSSSLRKMSHGTESLVGSCNGEALSTSQTGILERVGLGTPCMTFLSCYLVFQTWGSLCTVLSGCSLLDVS